MKFFARFTGTWLLGLALILLIIDGTKSLAASRFVMTPLGEVWQGAHQASWQFVYDVIAGWFAPLSGQIADLFFGWPGWITLGVLGTLLALAGRRRAPVTYVESF